MTITPKAAIIIGAALLLAALVNGGRYEMATSGTVTYVVDRHLGLVWLCTVSGCRRD
jgi:hypothetical protein